MDTTGSSPEQGSQSTTAPDDWIENPYVQIEGGFLAGLAEGFVPFSGVGHQLLDLGEVIPHGTPQARLGLAVGQVLGGIVTLLGGVTGEVLGGAATTSGIGAVVGLPTIAVSTTFVVGGFANIAAGLQGLMTTGSGGTGPQGTAPAAKGGDTVRLRHYTNSKGLRGIQEEGVIRASDQNKVFSVKAQGKPGSPRDVEEALGIKRGRGNNYVEFDAQPGEFKIVRNPQTGATETVFDGDLDLATRNPTYHKNR